MRELARDGASLDELREAIEGDRLSLLPLERALAGEDDARYTIAELSNRSGVEEPYLRALRRALGLPRADGREPVGDDTDVEAAEMVQGFRDAGLPDEPTASRHHRGMIDVAIADAGLADELTALINDVYAVAESGLWREGTPRTTSADLAALIAAGEIAVATRDGAVAGCVHVFDVSPDTCGFGMLAAAPEHRDAGIGRALLDDAERRAAARGIRTMQLELLVPREWSHPSKEFLKSWYGHRGYRLARVGRLDDNYPELAPLLATACDLEIHEKSLMG